MKSSVLFLLTGALLFSAGAAQAAEDRKTKVLKDRKSVADAGEWIYNDLAQGFAEAKRTGKPLLVTLRCIP
jgi:serine protease Do